jgi:hypothetical protein
VTKVFNPTSYFEGSWEEGSIINFFGIEKDGGTISGMHSRIKENRLHEFISIEHLGFISGGVIDTKSEEVKKWTPAFENYTFTEVPGGTEVTVDMDIEESHKEMFEEIWPQALQKLKELSEE